MCIRDRCKDDHATRGRYNYIRRHNFLVDPTSGAETVLCPDLANCVKKCYPVSASSNLCCRWSLIQPTTVTETVFGVDLTTCIHDGDTVIDATTHVLDVQE